MPPLHEGHAKARALVRLQDGRTARLIWLPPRGRTAKANVELPGGARLRIPAESLTLVEDPSLDPGGGMTYPRRDATPPPPRRS